MLYQHITAYSSAIKFTRLMLGNICVQAEGMPRPMEILVLAQHHVGRILLTLIWVWGGGGGIPPPPPPSPDAQ